MADALQAAFSSIKCGPICLGGTMDSTMIEILFIYQLARKPVQAYARRWWCRSLFHATRGKRRCPECNSLK
jgi:hypothetical protein